MHRPAAFARFAALALLLPAAAQAQLVQPAPAPAPPGGPMMDIPAELPSMTSSPAPKTVVAGPDALPPIRYVGTVAGDELFNLLQADSRFVRLSKDLPGSPLMLRVTHSFEMTAGGKAAGFTSALLAGSTLGLLPVVTNQDLAITYEFVVNGVPLSSQVFRRNFTRSQNIFAQDTTYGLGKEGLAWAKETAGEFLAAARNDAKLAALVDEYRFYFEAPPAPPPAPVPATAAPPAPAKPAAAAAPARPAA